MVVKSDGVFVGGDVEGVVADDGVIIVDFLFHAMLFANSSCGSICVSFLYTKGYFQRLCLLFI